MAMPIAVGIDLGTTNTAIAAVREGVVSTLADSAADRLLPSVVSFHPSGSVLVGRAAREQRLVDPANTIYSVKRLLGRPFSAPEVQAAVARMPFRLAEGPKGGTLVWGRGDTFSLPEMSAFVLRQARLIAEEALGHAVERAVITVPANFNDLQRAATKSAGRLAGFEVLRILNEPTAAALAYGADASAHERVAVYDLGGGTFDVSILDLVGDVIEVLATAGDTALGGDDIDDAIAARMASDMFATHRFDPARSPSVMARLRITGEELKRELSFADVHALRLPDVLPGAGGATVPWVFRMSRDELDSLAQPFVQRTLGVCEQALAGASLRAGDIDRVLLVGGATRMPMVAREVGRFFGRAPVMSINPDEVVALGAAIQADLLDRSRTRTAVATELPRAATTSVGPAAPDASLAEVPDLPPLPVIAVGARERTKRGEDTGPAPPPIPDAPQRRAPSEDIQPLSPPRPPPLRTAATFGDLESQFLPGVSSKPLVFDVPERASRALAAPSLPAPPIAHKPARPPVPLAPAIPSGAAVLPGAAVPPGSAASPGAAASPTPAATALPPPPAAQPPPASIIALQARRRAPPLLIDVTPLSLSVETVGGYSDVLVDANTPIPCDKTRTFATASDRQTSVVVRVAQGESRRFADNAFLGEVKLSELPSAARGEASVAVTFEIDADGILNVRARDVRTNREAVATLHLAFAPDSPGDRASMQARQEAHPIARPLAMRPSR